jgi:cytochrome c oxidase subunit IV
MTETHETPAAHPDGHPDEHKHHGSTSPGMIITILLVLAFLTVIEVFIPRVYSADHSAHTKMLLLNMLAFGKATIVAAFFMHLKWEKPWLKYIALMPAYMGVFAILLMIESFYR